MAIAVTAAGAAGAAEPTPAEKETARGLMDEGHARDDRGDHAGALESFRAADALMHVPTTGLEVGRQQVALKLLVDARDTLLSVCRLPVVSGEPAAFAAARDQAQSMYDALTPRIPALRVSVIGGSKLAATLQIDGIRIPASAAGVPFRVNPGHHVVSASSENGGHAEEGVERRRGGREGGRADPPRRARGRDARGDSCRGDVGSR